MAMRQETAGSCGSYVYEEVAEEKNGEHGSQTGVYGIWCLGRKSGIYQNIHEAVRDLRFWETGRRGLRRMTYYLERAAASRTDFMFVKYLRQIAGTETIQPLCGITRCVAMTGAILPGS